MKVAYRILLLVAMSFALAACGGNERSSSSQSAGSQKPITVKGSDTMVILGQRFAEEYMKANPGVVVQVNGGGSGTGIAALINGTVDLAQSSRPMKPKERADAEKNRGSQLVETPVALDALAVFVHANNPVKELSLEQIAAIYSGKTTNWNEIGGPNAPIVIYGRENNSGTYEYFREHVLQNADFGARVQTLSGTAAVINAVGRDVNGIGYGGIAYSKDVQTVAVKKDAASPAVAPTEEHVADNSYPISRQLYFYSFANARPELQQFIEWAASPAGQSVVENVGYYPLSTGSTATDTTTTETATTTDTATDTAATTATSDTSSQ